MGFDVNNTYTANSGTSNTDLEFAVFSTDDPTVNDINYPIQKRWVNTSSGTNFILISYDQSNGQVTANWLQIGTSNERVSGLLALADAISVPTDTTTLLVTISLSAGIWSVSGVVGYTGNPGGATGSFVCQVIEDGGTSVVGKNTIRNGFLPTVNYGASIVCPPYALTLTETTDVFLNAYAFYGTGSVTAYGSIYAVRLV